MVALAASPLLRSRLARAGRRSAAQRTWTRALDRLGAGYMAALEGASGIRDVA